MRHVLPIAAALLCARPAPVEWASSTPWPLERLVKNLEAFVAEHPDDAHAHYVLGRVHGQAFVLATRTIGLHVPADEPIEGLLGRLQKSFDVKSSQRVFANGKMRKQRYVLARSRQFIERGEWN